ncbi:MAG: tRNA pseudouridine(55) synthase TruB [Dehalococcoidia bacterium]
MERSIDGIINLNKPRGRTSFQMVSVVRKLTGFPKAGHAGTLDPDATGVLPILLGRATRLVPFLTDSPKVYRAGIEFGRSTATYDSSGDTTAEGDASSLTLEVIEEALGRFRGTIEQIPPMYSAVKHQGKPLYKLARAGLEVPRQPREVRIFRLEALEWQKPLLSAEVECSKGTYIRSLAHDLGEVLGCGACLKQLTRIQTGPFNINQSITPEELEKASSEGSWQNLVHPPDTALMHLAAITVDEEGEENIKYGRPVFAVGGHEANDGQPGRAYSGDGRFLALVCFREETGLWHPKRVFG